MVNTKKHGDPMRYLIVIFAVLAISSTAYAAQTTVNTASDTFETAANRQQAMNTELYAQYPTKWTSGEAYTTDNQMVVHGGAIYICTSNHTAGASTEPGVGVSWATVWKFWGAALYQPLDSDLTIYAGITPSANVQSYLAAATYAAMRTLLDLEPGTDFYSISAADAAFQPLESTLIDIADGTIAENLVNTANPWADNEVADDITASNYLPLAGGTLTGELVVDELGIEGQPTDSIADCSSFAATGGGIFYDDSEGKWKKCQDNVLTDLDTNTGTATAWDDIGNPDANDEIDFGSYVIELNVEDFQIGDGGGTNYFRFWSDGGTIKLQPYGNAVMVTGTQTVTNDAAIRTGTTAAQYFYLSAYDVGATSYTPLLGLYAHATVPYARFGNQATNYVQINDAGQGTFGGSAGFDFSGGSHTWPTFNQSTTGNASTASALAANGSNCSAGSYPLGVDENGAVEGCTDATTEIDSAISIHASNASAHRDEDAVEALIFDNDNTGDLETTGYVSGQAKVVTDASGAITITINSVNYGTDTGDADIPDGACDAAGDVGNWVVLISDTADTYSLTSDDASNVFILPDLTALDAGDELDVDGSQVSVVCVAAETWKVTGYIGAAPTDGGVAD